MGTRNRMMLAGKRIETEKNRIRPDFLNVGWNRLSEVNNRMFEALPTVFNGEINFVQEIYAAVNMISHINPLIEKYRANNGELSFSDSLHIILHYIALLEDESKSLGLSQIGFNAKYQVIFDQYYHLSLSLLIVFTEDLNSMDILVVRVTTHMILFESNPLMPTLFDFSLSWMNDERIEHSPAVTALSTTVNLIFNCHK